MGNLAVGHANLIDAATLTASDSSVLLPVTRLKDPSIGVRWHSLTLTPWLLTSSIGPFDHIFLKGLLVSEDCTIRARVSSTDATGATGDLFDQTYEHGDPEFDATLEATLSIILPSAVIGYLRFDFDEDGSGRTYVAAGRPGAFLLHQFSYNFTRAAAATPVDPSVTAKTVGGQIVTRRKQGYRLLNFPLDWVTKSDRFGVVETLDRVNGRTKEVVFIVNPDSDNLARDTIVGLLTDLSPVGFANVHDSNGPLYTKTWSIEERL